MFAKVVVDMPLNTSFTYRVPEALAGKLSPAQRVHVPFGRGQRVGYVVLLLDKPDCDESRIKDIADTVDDAPLFMPGLVELARWISSYYVCPLYAAFEAMLPTGIKKGSRGRQIKVIHIKAGLEDLKELRAETGDPNSPRGRMLGALIGRLEASEFVAPQSHLLKEAGTSASPLNTLEKNGAVEIVKQEVTLETAVTAAHVHHTVRGEITLTPEQVAAVDAILAPIETGEFKVFLLHGVTGSGKTEVYLDAIERVIKLKRQAIVLVPEISLTPQTVSRFAVRFERLALLHSQQTQAVRRETWRAIAAGEADVIIGPQSAVFAPVPSLGLIVVDEEHEPSFKNLAAPRYNARDVAVMRGKITSCPIVLGSATPDLVTYHNATETDKYVYLSLPERVTEQELPQVRVIDMGVESRREHRRVSFSRELLERLRECLQAGEQALLFLNRRGYQPFVRCKKHGGTVKCPRCSVALTYHQNVNALVCHYCSRRISADRCPECGSTDLWRSGIGTEWVEENIGNLVPGIICARMDTDTMRSRSEYDRVLGEFRAGEIDCLVGTQMIAKGLDFPNVTLVGVMAADQILDFPDFRAAERTFQLMVQVGGRAGRGTRRGTVIVQSWNPQHEVIQFAARHDYESFAEHELAIRRQFNYGAYNRPRKRAPSRQKHPRHRRRRPGDDVLRLRNAVLHKSRPVRELISLESTFHNKYSAETIWSGVKKR
jgi:primosomal protein N' (replication factor Y)